MIVKPSDFQKTIQCQFDCKLKKVVKGIVRNYRKELARRQAKEVSFCELPEIVVEKLIDIVNIGLHFILKNVRPYAAPCSEA